MQPEERDPRCYGSAQTRRLRRSTGYASVLNDRLQVRQAFH